MADDPKKSIKKGEKLFKAGDTMDRLYFVQSGRVELSLPRQGHNQSLIELAAPIVLGEQALWGVTKHAFTAEALSPLTILEVPVSKAQGQLESASPFLKIFAKGIFDQNKQLMAQVKSLQMQNDSAPCPPFVVPKVFYILANFAQYRGEKSKDGRSVLKWRFVRDFAFKVFQEPVKRMENAVLLLQKLDMAELTYKLVKEDEEDEKEIAVEVLDEIYIKDPAIVEEFSDFYQTYFYKPEYAQILKVEERITQMVSFLVRATEGLEVTHFGSVRILLSELVQKAKEERLPVINSDHLELLKQKGLFCKSVPNEDGEVLVSFDREEFAKVLNFWRILLEVDKWNERGQVLPDEVARESLGAEHSCSSCGKEVPEAAKFCPECGFQLSTSKAA